MDLYFACLFVNINLQRIGKKEKKERHQSFFSLRSTILQSMASLPPQCPFLLPWGPLPLRSSAGTCYCSQCWTITKGLSPFLATGGHLTSQRSPGSPVWGMCPKEANAGVRHLMRSIHSGETEVEGVSEQRSLGSWLSDSFHELSCLLDTCIFSGNSIYTTGNSR